MTGTVNSATPIGFDTSPSIDTHTAPYDSAVSVLLTGTVLANAGVQTIEIYDSGHDIGAAAFDARKPSSWSLDVNLAAGTHQFTAQAFGLNGSVASATSAFTLVTGLNNPNYTTAEYDTDGNGNRTGESYFDASGTLRRQTVVDSSGTLVSDTSYSKTAVVTSQTTYNSNGTLAGQVTYNSQGTITSQATYDGNGNVTYKTTTDSLGNIVGKTWYDGAGHISEQKTYDATGNQTIETIETGQNTHLITGKMPGIVLSSIANDLMTGSTGGHNTYHFGTSFGHDEITSFIAAGASKADNNHDVIDLPAAKLKSVAAVLQHTTMGIDGSAIIHLDHNNSIKLDGVTKADLLSNRADIHLYS